MIQVFDLLGRPIGTITKYRDLCISSRLDSWPEMTFTVPATDKNRVLLQNEVILEFCGEPFIVKNTSPTRDSGGSRIISVTAPSIAIELNYKPRQVVGTYIGAEQYSNWEALHRYNRGDRIKHYGVVYECVIGHTSGSSLSGSQWNFWTTCNIQSELAELVLSAREMMSFALENTGWTPGVVDDDGAARTFSGEWMSVPSLLQEMAEKFDCHIVYRPRDRKVDFVKEPGRDTGATIEYGKNLTGIRKSADSTDFITKLYLYGDEDLTVNEVNIHGPDESPLDQLQNGQSFITDFSFFLEQGYTETEIYEDIMANGDASKFIRIGHLKLDDFVDADQLLIEGRKQLAKMSKPEVSYSVDYVRLSDLLVEDADETFDIGDWVYVRDLELGVDIKVRVLSTNIYPGFPEKSSCELSNKDELFAEAITSSIEYNKKLSENPAVSELLKGYISTFTTTINSGRGDLVWKDGQLTAIALDAEGKPTGNQVRLTPNGLGVSTNFGVTYENAITGEGVLAEKVLANSIHVLSVGSDGIVIEPNSCGVRLNNTEGIVVQSADKRFKATMKASDDMPGNAYGFALWNGDFDSSGNYTGDSLVFGVTMNGNAYFKGHVEASSGSFTGTVNATDGVFAGIVRATDFQDEFGNSLLANGKWKSSMLDLGKIKIDGTTGDITLEGNINLSNGVIQWSQSSSPIRYQYSSDNVNWHSTMQPGDIYRRDSTDGGNTWTPGYQFVGRDGRDGSDASVPGYITQTVIGPNEIEAHLIRGNIVQIYIPPSPGSSSTPPGSDHGLEFQVMYNGMKLSPVKFYYYGGDVAPYAVFDTIGNCYAKWRYPVTDFDNHVNFYGQVHFANPPTGIVGRFG